MKWSRDLEDPRFFRGFTTVLCLFLAAVGDYPFFDCPLNRFWSLNFGLGLPEIPIRSVVMIPSLTLFDFDRFDWCGRMAPINRYASLSSDDPGGHTHIQVTLLVLFLTQSDILRVSRKPVRRYPRDVVREAIL
jgi:hypothetical protein